MKRGKVRVKLPSGTEGTFADPVEAREFVKRVTSVQPAVKKG